MNLLYAMRGGELVSIMQVQRGAKCGCVCPGCGERLLAKQGKIKQWHFAHESGGECASGYESSLHLLAKEILLESKSLSLPEIILNFPSGKKPVSILPPSNIDIVDVDLERRVNDIIPDVVVHGRAYDIFVEITVTHGIDDVKVKKLRALGIPCMEINLKHEDRDVDKQMLADIIASGEHARWAYHPLADSLYRKFIGVSDFCGYDYSKKHSIGECPISKVSFADEVEREILENCGRCEYCIDYKTMLDSDNFRLLSITVACSGRERIAKIDDFDLPLHVRLKNHADREFHDRVMDVLYGICPLCNSRLRSINGKYGPFYACRNRNCDFTISFSKIVNHAVCPECKHNLYIDKGRRGSFVGCKYCMFSIDTRW